MTIKDFIKTVNDCYPNNKLRAVKLVNDARGGGLRESKEIIDEVFGSKVGEATIMVLRTKDWKTIKSNIRKLKV